MRPRRERRLPSFVGARERHLPSVTEVPSCRVGARLAETVLAAPDVPRGDTVTGMGAPAQGQSGDVHDSAWPRHWYGYVLIAVAVAVVLVALWLLGGVLES